MYFLRKPIDEFLLVRKKIEEIGQSEDLELIFKDLSEALSVVENDILTDQISKDFKEDLGTLIINYLAILTVNYNIDDMYSYLLSRQHWGIYDKDYFKDTKLALVNPYYNMRREVTNLIIDRKKGISAKPLFDLTAYLIYLEEMDN